MPKVKSKVPQKGELWAKPNHPMVMILKPQGQKRFLLATIDTSKGKALTKTGLNRALKGFEKVGAFCFPSEKGQR